MEPQPSLSEVRKIIFLLPVWQILIGVIVGIIFYFISGGIAGIAGFFGASISCAGSAVFAFVIFGFGNKSTKNMHSNLMRQMFRAEAFKILTIAIMFYVSFAKLGLPFLPVIVGFMATLIIFFVALLRVFR